MATVTSPATVGSPRRGKVTHAGTIGMLVGGGMIAVGSVLPWASTPLGSVSGMAGAGLWTLCAGVIAIAGALLPRRGLAMWHALLAGGASAALIVWQLARMVQISAQTDSWGKLLPGIGLVLVAGGAVVLLRAGLRLRA